MFRESAMALRACLVTFALCAFAYPMAAWGLASLAFPEKAAGSLVFGRDRTVIGSSLIAQPFTSDRYFHPRPSSVDFKADAAGGSNLGPKSPALRKRVEEAASALGGSTSSPIPVDLVTASGSGLDPHISPESARFQAARVASARRRPLAEIQAAIDDAVESSGSVIGAPPRVNVLRLNLTLDHAASR